jgi:hypothetical protein
MTTASTADGITPTAVGAGRALTSTERAAIALLGVLAGALGAVGFVNSFARVAAAAQPSFGRLAPTVPLGIDVGIAVFCGVDIVLARLDMRPKWVRLIPWALTTATVYLNVSGQTSWFARIAHAVFPALWVIAVELAAHVVRVRAGLAAGTRMDAIRVSRWLLAPVSTAGLWRRMVLWETRSYPEALHRERSRLLALTTLQDRYGHLAWRWKAPRRDRALYRLGELVPATDVTARPDTRADIGADTPDMIADTPTGIGPDMTTDIGRTDGRTSRRTATGAAVARLRTRHPDMAATDIARRLGVTDRTVRRHLASAPGTAGQRASVQATRARTSGSPAMSIAGQPGQGAISSLASEAEGDPRGPGILHVLDGTAGGQ